MAGLVTTRTTRESIAEVRALLSAALPVRYADSFYTALLDAERVSVEARTADTSVLVGHAAWMVQHVDGVHGELYVLALVVDARFRRMGVGTMLVAEAIKGAVARRDVERVILHVQTSNEDALAFYEKLGFHVIDTLMGYYSSRVSAFRPLGGQLTCVVRARSARCALA